MIKAISNCSSCIVLCCLATAFNCVSVGAQESFDSLGSSVVDQDPTSASLAKSTQRNSHRKDSRGCLKGSVRITDRVSKGSGRRGSGTSGRARKIDWVELERNHPEKVFHIEMSELNVQSLHAPDLQREDRAQTMYGTLRNKLEWMEKHPQISDTIRSKQESEGVVALTPYGFRLLRANKLPDFVVEFPVIIVNAEAHVNDPPGRVRYASTDAHGVELPKKSP